MNVFDAPSSSLRRMSVCPHDTARTVLGWFLLNSYLRDRLRIPLHFEPQENFLAEREAVLEGGYDVVYANPYSAVQFARDRGFIPVARPAGTYDETYLVARPDWRLSGRHQRVIIASATDKLIVHALGATLLPRLGLDEAMVDYQFTGNHAAAAQAVIDGAADLGFVFNETWNALSAFDHPPLQVLRRTNRSQAFHCFMVSPELQDRASDIQAVLTGMTTDPDAAEVVQELNFPHGIVPAGPADLAVLSALVPHAMA